MKATHNPTGLILSWLLVFIALLPPAGWARTQVDETLAHSLTLSAAQCQSTPHAVWVETSQGSECIRYFPAGLQTHATQAVLYFHGDRHRNALDKIADNRLSDQLGKASRRAQKYALPWIRVARPGLYGSSGDHRQRRLPKEFYTLKAAADTIRARHQIDQITLLGHSGGGAVVIALLTLGFDTRCAVTTSGSFAVITETEQKRRDPSSSYYRNPLPVNRIGNIPARPDRRIFLLADPRDATVPFRVQRELADQLTAAGHAVTLITVAGQPPDHHLLGEVGDQVAAWCTQGMSTSDIVQRVQGRDGLDSDTD